MFGMHDWTGSELPRRARRWLCALAGGAIVLVGVLMILTPGPAILVIPFGLSILAAEFAWARHWMRRWLPVAWQPDWLARDGRPGASTTQERP